MMNTGQQEGRWVQTPSGLILPEKTARESYPLRPTAGDLFSGCGGFSLGIIQAGFRVVFAAEYSIDAVMTYMVNLCRWGQVKIHFIEPADEQRMEAAVKKMFDAATKHGKSAAPTAWLESDLPLCGTGWIAGQPDSMPGVEHIIVGDVRKLTGEQILA